jgi:hypothetical protein
MDEANYDGGKRESRMFGKPKIFTRSIAWRVFSKRKRRAGFPVEASAANENLG